ncbi:MAG TPA: VCBS repeat-containing protein [Polyangiaceae bacterium]
MRIPRVIAVAALLVPFEGCRTLPEIPGGACGNHVIDPGEDCDGFERFGKSCRPPGAAGACHLDCSGPSDAACPIGYGCDAAGVCRRPTGNFEPPSSEIRGAALRLASGDFDGDGRSDIVSRGSPGFFGLAQLGIHYFDRNAVAEDGWVTSQLFGNTIAAQLSRGDARADLLVSQFAFCAMLGESNRTLTPFAHPSYLMDGRLTLVTPVLDRRVDASSALSVLRHIDGAFQLERPSRDPTQRLVPVAHLPGALDALAGRPTTAHLFDDRERHPCAELGVAVRGLSELHLYQLCTKDAKGLHWKDEPIVTRVAFDPPAEPNASPLFADLDGEGHLDVLIATDSGPYAAYNDGERIGALEPFTIRLADADEPSSDSPVAAGDVSGDGTADLVLPQVLVIAERVDGELQYRAKHGARQGRWTSGGVADLNADGKLDALATSDASPGIEIYLGTGTDRLNHFTIPTGHLVQELTVGDYDGDAVLDLAFVAPGRGASGDDLLSVAFGNPSGFPDPPISIAHAERVRQLLAGADNDEDTMSDLLVVSELADEAATANPQSSLSILVGTTDRVFFSPILLTTFSTDGTLEEADGLAATAGHFADPNRLDLVAVGGRPREKEDGSFELVFSLWLLPDFPSGRSTPQLLPWEFPSELEPVLPDPNGAPLSVTFVAADLDGDARDELVLAAPIEGGARCLLTWATVADGAARLGSVSTLELDEPCALEPPLEIRDLDGDSAGDIALLTGSAEGAGVRVFWNDGYGGFSPQRSTRVEHPDGVRAFTTFQLTGDAPLALAYATPQSVNLVDVNSADRTFSEPAIFQDGYRFTLLTGITAGDVNGDGVSDLAVADAGSVRVLKAILEQ